MVLATVVLLAAGVRWPRLTPVAVLAVVGALLVARGGVIEYAAGGLGATAYLVVVHRIRSSVRPAPADRAAVVVGAVSFTLVAAAVLLMPVHLRWIPVLAPFTALALVVVPVRR
ncbi:hypothetical protein [Nocardia aurantia]|nr:hypothetical protein [Nocardia aurantia]